MNTRILIVGLFAIILAHKDGFVAGVLMKFTNAVCTSYNESLAKIHMCRIRAINRYKNIFNYNMTLLQLIYSVKTRFQIFKRENGYKPWLYDITIDACQFLRKPTNPAVIFLVKQTKNFTNFFDQKCPVSGVKKIDGFYFNPKTMKLPMPTGEYMLKNTWILNEKLTVIANISIQFVEDLI